MAISTYTIKTKRNVLPTVDFAKQETWFRALPPLQYGTTYLLRKKLGWVKDCRLRVVRNKLHYPLEKEGVFAGYATVDSTGGKFNSREAESGACFVISSKEYRGRHGFTGEKDFLEDETPKFIVEGLADAYSLFFLLKMQKSFTVGREFYVVCLCGLQNLRPFLSLYGNVGVESSWIIAVDNDKMGWEMKKDFDSTPRYNRFIFPEERYKDWSEQYQDSRMFAPFYEECTFTCQGETEYVKRRLK